MAITSLSGPIFYPDMPTGTGSPPSVAGQLRILNTVPKAAFTFIVPKSGTLDQVEFFLLTVGTAQAIKVSFQDIDPATGNPDGAIDQFRVVATGSVTVGWMAPGLMTSDGTNTGVKRTVSVGDLLCVVFEFDSTAGDVKFSTTSRTNASALMADGMAYTSTNNGSAWTKSGDVLCMALKYDDGSYAYVGPLVWPVTSLTTRTYNSGSTPDERGLYFSLPVGVSVSGAWVLGAWTGDATITLYDTDGTTVIASAPQDKDNDLGSTAPIPFWFTAPVTLTASGNYRLTVLPTSATNLSIYELNVNASALMAGMAGGTAMIGTSRTDAGAWTQDGTVRPLMGLTIGGIDTGSSGGGATAHVFG